VCCLVMIGVRAPPTSKANQRLVLCCRRGFFAESFRSLGADLLLRSVVAPAPVDDGPPALLPRSATGAFGVFLEGSPCGGIPRQPEKQRWLVLVPCPALQLLSFVLFCRLLCFFFFCSFSFAALCRFCSYRMGAKPALVPSPEILTTPSEPCYPHANEGGQKAVRGRPRSRQVPKAVAERITEQRRRAVGVSTTTPAPTLAFPP